MITPAYICDAIRTPFGRYGGLLSAVRADDLAALPLLALMERQPGMDWEQVSDVLLGCGSQAGEDSRNVARMACLLAGLPATVSAATINRLCGSGLDAIGAAARAVRCGEASVMLAGGIESMSRAPFVSGKLEALLSRSLKMEDGSDGWRFINPLLKAQYGIQSLPQVAETIAREIKIDRAAQDNFALDSRRKAAIARRNGRHEAEITPVAVAQKNGEPVLITEDEHPAAVSPSELALAEPLINGGSITSANIAAIADGACALLLACEKSMRKYHLRPKARVLTMATAGGPPRLGGMAAAPAARKALVQSGLNMDDMDVIELHEASAAQCIAVLRDWGLQDDDVRVNPNGGALALGDPAGASGARLVLSALNQLHANLGRYALCAAGIDAGQGIALIIERV